MDKGLNLTLQICSIYGRSKNMLLSESFETIELLTCQGFGYSRYFVWYSLLSESTVLQLFLFNTNLTKPLQANLDESGLQRALRHYALGAQSVLG